MALGRGNIRYAPGCGLRNLLVSAVRPATGPGDVVRIYAWPPVPLVCYPILFSLVCAQCWAHGNLCSCSDGGPGLAICCFAGRARPGQIASLLFTNPRIGRGGTVGNRPAFFMRSLASSRPAAGDRKRHPEGNRAVAEATGGFAERKRVSGAAGIHRIFFADEDARYTGFVLGGSGVGGK